MAEDARRSAQEPQASGSRTPSQNGRSIRQPNLRPPPSTPGLLGFFSPALKLLGIDVDANKDEPSSPTSSLSSESADTELAAEPSHSPTAPQHVPHKRVPITPGARKDVKRLNLEHDDPLDEQSVEKRRRTEQKSQNESSFGSGVLKRQADLAQIRTNANPLGISRKTPFTQTAMRSTVAKRKEPPAAVFGQIKSAPAQHQQQKQQKYASAAASDKSNHLLFGAVPESKPKMERPAPYKPIFRCPFPEFDPVTKKFLPTYKDKAVPKRPENQNDGMSKLSQLIQENHSKLEPSEDFQGGFVFRPADPKVEMKRIPTFKRIHPANTAGKPLDIAEKSTDGNPFLLEPPSSAVNAPVAGSSHVQNETTQIPAASELGSAVKLDKGKQPLKDASASRIDPSDANTFIEFLKSKLGQEKTDDLLFEFNSLGKRKQRESAVVESSGANKFPRLGSSTHARQYASPLANNNAGPSDFLGDFNKKQTSEQHRSFGASPSADEKEAKKLQEEYARLYHEDSGIPKYTSFDKPFEFFYPNAAHYKQTQSPEAQAPSFPEFPVPKLPQASKTPLKSSSLSAAATSSAPKRALSVAAQTILSAVEEVESGTIFDRKSSVVRDPNSFNDTVNRMMGPKPIVAKQVVPDSSVASSSQETDLTKQIDVYAEFDEPYLYPPDLIVLPEPKKIIVGSTDPKLYPIEGYTASDLLRIFNQLKRPDMTMKNAKFYPVWLKRRELEKEESIQSTQVAQVAQQTIPQTTSQVHAARPAQQIQPTKPLQPAQKRTEASAVPTMQVQSKPIEKPAAISHESVSDGVVSQPKLPEYSFTIDQSDAIRISSTNKRTDALTAAQMKSATDAILRAVAAKQVPTFSFDLIRTKNNAIVAKKVEPKTVENVSKQVNPQSTMVSARRALELAATTTDLPNHKFDFTSNNDLRKYEQIPIWIQMKTKVAQMRMDELKHVSFEIDSNQFNNLMRMSMPVNRRIQQLRDDI